MGLSGSTVAQVQRSAVLCASARSGQVREGGGGVGGCVCGGCAANYSREHQLTSKTEPALTHITCLRCRAGPRRAQNLPDLAQNAQMSPCSGLLIIIIIITAGTILRTSNQCFVLIQSPSCAGRGSARAVMLG